MLKHALPTLIGAALSLVFTVAFTNAQLGQPVFSLAAVCADPGPFETVERLCAPEEETQK